MKYLVILFSVLSYAQSISKSMKLLPDTGQSVSYTTIFGQDSDYSINVPSFANNGNGTINDNITNLMWQQIDGGEMTHANAVIYADNLVLGGHSDWRLPTPRESVSILNFQNNNPALNATYFTNTNAQYWWTNTFELNSTSKVWVTNAGGGVGNKPILETISAGGSFRYHARTVRDVVAPTVISSQYTDNGDGTITDHLTQLTWEKIPNPNMFTWENAILYSENLVIGAASDWRLPNIKELQSLNNEALFNPSVNQTYFNSIGVKSYWSATTLANQTLNAWFYNTAFGATSNNFKTTANYVISVRGIPTLSTVNIDKKSKLFVYPNPFSSKIKIENSTGNEFFILYNQMGQILFSGSDIKAKDFSELSAGLYILDIIGVTNSKVKLIKN